ncbi:chemotaxis protein methyltransferase CheR [Natranaerovirga pectinivora]|uniref:protein-glutamate O-methyltransferase n=1 Tax=Natranaerovirga pectinivora TaxID=682400 RepID=A0A4R3MNP2_9FIRM|nr:protein-glutamate O-methyltransferase CheR [Natranaerovirga pectinivora]TCT15000.1 chemotaxis protein methyltransferase CheR [Natranaerovirga pectinivora]
MLNDYESFKKEIYALTNIDLNAYKERQMKRRIDSLIKKNSYDDYVSYVKALKTNKDLFEEFVNYLTINVSEFYRNPEQWKILEDYVLPHLFNKAGKKVKIWSAACSTGDEPYSLVMLLSKFMPLSQIKIIATDIDKQVLSKAQLGLYTEKSLAALPVEFKEKYFRKVGTSSFQVIEDIKKCVEFKQHNLLKDEYPSQCDLIVCRNVLIYFTEDAKIEIYKKFNKGLKKEGILFVGSTEQIIQPQVFKFSAFKSFFYQKENDL